jgi:hypothetical protein
MIVCSAVASMLASFGASLIFRWEFVRLGGALDYHQLK